MTEWTSTPAGWVNEDGEIIEIPSNTDSLQWLLTRQRDATEQENAWKALKGTYGSLAAKHWPTGEKGEVPAKVVYSEVTGYAKSRTNRTVDGEKFAALILERYAAAFAPVASLSDVGRLLACIKSIDAERAGKVLAELFASCETESPGAHWIETRKTPQRAPTLPRATR